MLNKYEEKKNYRVFTITIQNRFRLNSQSNAKTFQDIYVYIYIVIFPNRSILNIWQVQ